MFFRNLLIKMNYAMSVATSAFFLSPIVIAQNIDSISNAKNAVAHKSEDNLIRLMFSYNYEDPINRRLLTKLDEYSNTTEGIVIIPDKYVGFSESEPPVKQPVPQSKIKKEQKIILALESSAAEYLYSQLDTIPAETPIILAEIDKYPADFIKKHKNTAAILRPDVSAKTVRFALELFPKAKNVYVLTDISPRGDFVSNDFNRIKKDFPGVNIIEIEHEKTSTHEMLSTISKTRGNDIIIFCSWLKDHDKASYTNTSIISQITEVTTAPIFSPFRDIISKNGILGGECMDFENFFALVLENMQKAVNSGIFGKDEIDIPKTERAVNFPMLAKYNINLSDIPKSVTLRKVPPDVLSNVQNHSAFHLCRNRLSVFRNYYDFNRRPENQETAQPSQFNIVADAVKPVHNKRGRENHNRLRARQDSGRDRHRRQKDRRNIRALYGYAPSHSEVFAFRRKNEDGRMVVYYAQRL